MLKFTPKPFSFPDFPLMERALNLFRVAVEDFVRDVNGCPFIKGSHIKDIDLTTSWTKVQHKLGRMPQGWILTAIYSRDTVAENIDARTSKYVELRASGNNTVSVWFF